MKLYNSLLNVIYFFLWKKLVYYIGKNIGKIVYYIGKN